MNILSFPGDKSRISFLYYNLYRSCVAYSKRSTVNTLKPCTIETLKMVVSYSKAVSMRNSVKQPF